MNKLIPLLVVLALSGCVAIPSYRADREHFRERLNAQSHRIYELERDIITLKRGYTIVPIRVAITNAAPNCK